MRQRFFADLMRLPTPEEEEMGDEVGYNLGELHSSMLVKNYQGIDVDLPDTLFGNVPKDVAISFIDYLFNIHSSLMYKSPLRSTLCMACGWLATYGDVEARRLVQQWVNEQNETIYLGQETTKFAALSRNHTNNRSPLATQGTLRVRYYGPIGTSGYARACQHIIKSLSEQPNLEVRFVVCSVQAAPEHWSADDAFLADHMYPRTDVDEYQVDVVFIHAVPDMVPPIVKRERASNPNVRIIGVTVWETSSLPPQWLPFMCWVDRWTVPNRWNKLVFEQDLPGLDVTYIPHPVLLKVIENAKGDLPVPSDGGDVDHGPGPDELVVANAMPGNPMAGNTLPGLKGAAACLAELKDLKDRGVYIFYVINEFSGRKGVDLSLEAYMKAFTSSDNVVFFLKVHGSVSRETALSFLEALSATVRDPPRVILEHGRWSDSEIDELHRLGNCFVSLTRSEGQGLGACTAGLLGKHVIMTRYGGQLDYLVDIAWVNVERLAPATFCSRIDERHDQCQSRVLCRDFPFFFPAQQQWALPSVSHAITLMKQAAFTRASGSASTVKFLTENFGVDKLGPLFAKYARDTASQDMCVRKKPLLGKIPDPYKRPLSFFASQDWLKIPPPVSTGRASKLRVIILGCSGYGNLGDDLYAELWSRLLGDKYDLYFCNTSTYVLETGKLNFIPKTRGAPSVPDDALIPDLLIIGGGGIIGTSELKSSIFRVYFPLAKANNIPLLLSSVGVAFDDSARTAPTVNESTLQAWTPLVTYASNISVRSIGDRDVVLAMLPRERHFRVRVCADLCFGAPSVLGLTADDISDERKIILYIPTNFLSVKYQDVAQAIQQAVFDNPDAQLVFLPMDGLRSAHEYPAAFVRDELHRFKKLFPQAKCYTGRFFSGPFLELLGAHCPSDAASNTVESIVGLFRRAVFVLSGRYHGLVLAKAFGVKHFTGSANLVKLVSERDSPIDLATWRKHIDAIADEAEVVSVLKKTKRQKQHELLSDPDRWSEDERNTCICDVVTQAPADEWSSTIPYTQGCNNEQLWRKRRVNVGKN